MTLCPMTGSWEGVVIPAGQNLGEFGYLLSVHEPFSDLKTLGRSSRVDRCHRDQFAPFGFS